MVTGFLELFRQDHTPDSERGNSMFGHIKPSVSAAFSRNSVMPKSTLVSMATGCGKTVVMGEVAARWKRGRILVIAHREELVFQNAKKIAAMTGEECAIEMADQTSVEASLWYSKARVVVASVQTLNSTRNGRPRMEKFNPDEFGLVMTDEAHHAVAQSYRNIYDWFGQNPHMKHLGVTATADRADEIALGQIYNSVAFDYGIQSAVKDGWLVPIEQQFVHVTGLDLSGCKSDRVDLKDVDVAKVMEQEELLHKVVDPVIELAGDRQALIFASSVQHAHKMEEIFSRHRSGSAVAIDGKTPREERREHLRRFANREFQYLVNMGVFLEGFDEPGIGLVAMARQPSSSSARCPGALTQRPPGFWLAKSFRR